MDYFSSELGSSPVVVNAPAHIRRTADVTQGFEQSLTVAEKEAVVAAVEAWLSEMLASSLIGEDDPDKPVRHIAVALASRWRRAGVALASRPKVTMGQAAKYPSTSERKSSQGKRSTAR